MIPSKTRLVLCSGTLLTCLGAQAQAIGQVGGQVGGPGQNQVFLVPNAQIAQTWQQNSPGATAPTIAQQEDGSTRVEWHGMATLDGYTNDVQSASGNLTSALRPGQYFKSLFNSDLRVIASDGAVDHMQIGLTNTNDRSVLSQNPYQINNIQLGKSGAGYMFAAGDVMPNFSSLGTSLAVRGIYGLRQFGGLSVLGFAGTVAESWEALGGTVASNQLLKEAYGIKLEQLVGNSLRVYATTQMFTERDPSQSVQMLPPSGNTSNTQSAGFQYQQGQYSLTGETASSRYAAPADQGRNGQATVLDASWRGETTGLRAGYHDIANTFTSLSVAAQPGVQETYSAMDWMAAPWLSLTADLRKSRATTMATAAMASSYVDTEAATLQAHLNFSAVLPGIAGTLQQSTSRSVDSSSQDARHDDWMSTLSYATPVCNATIGYGVSNMASATNPNADSSTSSWTLNLGRTYSDSNPGEPETWGAGFNLSASSQVQRLLLSDAQSANSNYTITANAQRAGWGRLNLMLTGGLTTQPNGGPGLRMQGVQLEAVRPFKGQNLFKLYVRNTNRNIGDALLAVLERIAGFQIIYNF